MPRFNLVLGGWLAGAGAGGAAVAAVRGLEGAAGGKGAAAGWEGGGGMGGRGGEGGEGGWASRRTDDRASGWAGRLTSHGQAWRVWAGLGQPIKSEPLDFNPTT